MKVRQYKKSPLNSHAKNVPIMENILTLGQKQLKRWHLLRMGIEKRISLKGATDRMEISCRHARQLKDIVVRDGSRGLVRGNKARRSVNVIDL